MIYYYHRSWRRQSKYYTCPLILVPSRAVDFVSYAAAEPSQLQDQLGLSDFGHNVGPDYYRALV